MTNKTAKINVVDLMVVIVMMGLTCEPLAIKVTAPPKLNAAITA